MRPTGGGGRRPARRPWRGAPPPAGRRWRALALSIVPFAGGCGDATGTDAIEQVFLIPQAATLVSPGQSLALGVGALTVGGDRITLTGAVWTSSEPKVASVDPSGRVTSMGNGTTTVTARVEGVVGQAEITVLVFESLAAGSIHTCGLTEEGRAYCWGWNAQGQLGDGTRTDRAFPTPVASEERFVVLAAEGHTCGVTTGDEAYCWGSNESGQLGDGSNRNRWAPARVVGDQGYRTIAAGVSTCAVVFDGSMRCWGQNGAGELGNGGTDDSWVPTEVVGGHTFSSVTVGGGQSCAVGEGGTAYCWGFNGVGQLGNGTSTVQPTPQPDDVGGGEPRFLEVSAGASHTCGVDVDRRIFCWGSNVHGKLGDGSGVRSTVPVRVSGPPYLTVRAAGESTCAIALGGDAYCWGANAFGQLGDGTTEDRATPVPVSGGLSFASITMSSGHTCGLTVDRVAYCWGANLRGELGDGTTVNSSVPVRVSGGAGG